MVPDLWVFASLGGGGRRLSFVAFQSVAGRALVLFSASGLVAQVGVGAFGHSCWDGVLLGLRGWFGSVFGAQVGVPSGGQSAPRAVVACWQSLKAFVLGLGSKVAGLFGLGIRVFVRPGFFRFLFFGAAAELSVQWRLKPWVLSSWRA